MRYWSTSKDQKDPKMACLKIYTLSFLLLLAFALETDAVSCCLSYTRHPRRCGILKGYIIQTMTGSCDLAAIIFQTEKGKSICADPAKDWTQKRVACLKMKAARMKTGGF
ncbi:C-C motif chemokine 20-like [Carassius carassius]|uniref:C-C motif chemokine 20-like n=1 Tax=Carassius carassius TaxID=217509 RepID=UPI002868ED77|nr:C-C motif chemokine 20-like [Carassius carassius]